MPMRSIKSIVTVSHPFALAEYSDELPAGEYEVLVEEELLQGASFVAYRKTGIYLMVHGRGRTAGRTEQRPITERDLETVFGTDL